VTQGPGEQQQEAVAPARPADAGERTGTRLGLALFLVSAAQFTLQLDFSIVNVALATIQREFGVSGVDLQWIVTGYALPFGALLLLGGRLADFTGRNPTVPRDAYVLRVAATVGRLGRQPYHPSTPNTSSEALAADLQGRQGAHRAG